MAKAVGVLEGRPLDRDLHRRVRRACASKAAYQVLTGRGHDFGFLDGGCWMLAEALRRVLGGALYAVYRVSGVMEHVVLRRRRGVYLDADGVATAAALLDKMRRQEGVRGRLSLRPFEAGRAGAIPYDKQTVADLTAHLALSLAGEAR